MSTRTFFGRPIYEMTLNMKCLMIITAQCAIETREYLRVQIITRFPGYSNPKYFLRPKTALSTPVFRCQTFVTILLDCGLWFPIRIAVSFYIQSLKRRN